MKPQSVVIHNIKRQAKLLDPDITCPAPWSGLLRREYKKNYTFAHDNALYGKTFNALSSSNYLKDGIDEIELLKWLHAGIGGSGNLRNQGVRIGRHKDFPHSSTVEHRLRGFFNELSTLSLPAELVAAKCHLELLLIHPFKDGNGRTARLMASYYLLKADYKSTLFTAVEQHFLHNPKKYIWLLSKYRDGKIGKAEVITGFLSAMQYSSYWIYWLKRRENILKTYFNIEDVYQFDIKLKKRNQNQRIRPLSKTRTEIPIVDLTYQLNRWLSEKQNTGERTLV